MNLFKKIKVWCSIKKYPYIKDIDDFLETLMLNGEFNGIKVNYTFYWDLICFEYQGKEIYIMYNKNDTTENFHRAFIENNKNHTTVYDEYRPSRAMELRLLDFIESRGYHNPRKIYIKQTIQNLINLSNPVSEVTA